MNAAKSSKKTGKAEAGPISTHLTPFPPATSHENVEIVRDNSDSFGIIPLNPGRPNSQHADSEINPRKQRSDSLEEKISPEQRSRLFEWLAQHSYTEVQELVAAELPEGFGFYVAKSTLSRFYKAHFTEIDSIRQLRLDARAYAISQINQGGDYAETLHNSSIQLLLERYFEMISNPLESIDDLKKLVAIAEKIQYLRGEEKRAAKLAHLFGAFTPPASPEPTSKPGSVGPTSHPSQGKEFK